MGKLQEEDLEFVFAIDMNNYELLYCNDFAKDSFSINDYKNKKCYEFFYGLESPCINCNTACFEKNRASLLLKNEDLEEKSRDFFLNFEGKKVRVSLVFNTNKRNEVLKNTLIENEFIFQCVNEICTASKIHVGLEKALALFGEKTEADRAFVILFNQNEMSSIYEWCAPGIKSNKELLQDLPLNLIENWLPSLMRKECVEVLNVEELRDINPKGYQLFKSGNINRFVIAPLIKDEKLCGFMGVDNPSQITLKNISPMISPLTYFVMSAITRIENEERLLQLSFHDSLTGLYNRNRYIEDLELLKNWKGSIGLIYADLNGLKEINDTRGHSGGNRAIIASARNLQAVFKDYNIYRVGGDEFVVFCKDIEEEQFLLLLKQLEIRIEKSNYKISVGYKWIEECEDIKKLVMDADHQMYQNKRKFYSGVDSGEKNPKITDKNTNSQLTEYNLLMSSMKVSVSKHLLQEDFKMIWANDYFYMLNGYSKEEFEELFDNKVSEYFKSTPAVYQYLIDVIQEAYLSKKSYYEATVCAKKKNGENIWIHLTGTFTNEYIDNVPVIYTVITNVNDTILAEKEQLITYESLPGFSAKICVRKDSLELVKGSQKFYDFFGEDEINVDNDLIEHNLKFNKKIIENNYEKLRLGETCNDELSLVDKNNNWYNFQIYGSCIDWHLEDPVYVFVFIDITEKVAQRINLLNLAYVDSITRGRSKTSFKEETMKILSNCKVNEYCLVSIDIVKFNAINDAFGIEEGNKILKYVYETIALNLSENECVARIESDVFDILMRNDGKEHIEKRLQEIVTQINRFNEMASIKYYISFACGIYCIEDPEMQLIKIQDRANLARKKLKNDIDAEFCQCRFYNTQDTLELIREKDIENKMRLALENHEFKLYLQPKFNLFTNKVDASEALIRWIGSEEIYPEEFIPLFERNGFIVELDYYVFEEVCKTIRKWLDNGVSFDTISFNMSRYNLANNDKLSRYEVLRNKYNIPSSYLEFEITESLIIESETVITRFIDNAKTLGYRCSIDDFGSGYSSLNVLKTIHADALKIDKEFFSEKGGKREETIIEFIIKLAHELGMKTVAEGVETKDQVDYLKTLGCDMIQGFYYSKPITVSEFERLYL
ncbi:MAG: EAL domain-containing protein [Anaerorhabdus sp.]